MSVTPSLEQAEALLRPYRSTGIRLDRIWPPKKNPGIFSKIGGEPDLPPNLAWPAITFPDGSSASLDFLAQINLQELPDVEARKVLPPSGMLYFFALSQTNDPLGEHGSDAWRVLYHPNTEISRATRPADTGWAIDHLMYGQMPARIYRNPDAPIGELFPECFVRLTAFDMWDMPKFSDLDETALQPFRDALPLPPATQKPEVDLMATFAAWAMGRPSPSTVGAANKTDAKADLKTLNSLAYRCFSALRAAERQAADRNRFRPAPKELPVHSEDAILLLNEARNSWFENVLPIQVVFDRQRNKLDGGREIYDAWKARAITLTQELIDRGREAGLSPELRQQVLGILEDHRQLRKQVIGYSGGQYLESAFRASLMSLLADFPNIALKKPELVVAGDPGNDSNLLGFSSHRMLGNGEGTQQDLGDDDVLLLQLTSDSDGPRFTWWDGGIIRFWINKRDLAALNFHLAEAEIEGH